MTKIEWCDKVWNPITGCTKISPGCQNCYAEKMAKRLKGRFGYPADDPFKVTFHPDKLEEPGKWKKPRRIFVCSMGDLFHHDVQFKIVDRILNAAYKAPQHTYLLLTKRPKRMTQYFESCRERGVPVLLWEEHGFELWKGVTAENQEQANKRIPILLQIPAAVKFVSVEPMLSEVDIKWALRPQLHPDLPCLNWVICGCESGAKRRLTKWEWVRNLKEQCVATGVPFFLKQMPPVNSTNWYPVKMPVLDGKIWDQYPEASK